MTHGNTRTPEYFWTRVKRGEDDECWPWQGRITSRGYGQMTLRTKRQGPHRHAWEITNGPIPNGLQVLHTCDNPICCNPHHLWLGTHQDNVDDKMAKGRWRGGSPGGERAAKAKLSWAIVERMRRENTPRTRTYRAIAQEYGIVDHTAWQVLNHVTWKVGA